MPRRVFWIASLACIFAASFLCAAIANRAASIHASPAAIAPQALPSPADGFADLVLENGIVYSGIAKTPRANGVAIRGEYIVAVTNTPQDLKPWIGPRTRVIDLKNQFAMPGWNDAHVHMAEAGYAGLEIRLDGVHSLAEFQQRIRDRLPQYKPGEWILGHGWDHTLWPGRKFPTRQDLDAVSTNHPMFMERVDGHVAVVNSLALRIAGITSKTPDPSAGRIERDSQTGEPTGMLEEDAGMDLVYSHVPAYSMEQRRKALQMSLDDAAQYGVTSVQDNSVQSAANHDNFGWDNFLVLRQLRREGKLKVRVTEWLPFDAPLAQVEEMRREGGASSAADPGDAWLKTGALKAFLDGSLGSRTAAMLAPYSDDPATSGILRVDPAKLTPMAIERDRAGFQIAFHAIGDRANRVALDTYAAVLAANGPRDRRDRIEHAQVVAPDDFPRFAQLRVIASMQPSHLLDDARWASDRLGPERSKGAYAWRTLQNEGVALAFGTDYPVEPINPLRGLYACVTRKLPDGSGPRNGWQPQEHLRAFDCIHDYTVGSAYAQFEEKRKGLLAPGMLADIVVYPRDINEVPARILFDLPVEMTITGGRIVYQKQPQ
ncbi:MAG TPA: amidohydrolase [Candidatus Acidoferrales bacterium]